MKKFILVLCTLFIIGICGGVIENAIAPHYTNDELAMVQPNGWIPGRDGYYAQEVNEPNSRSNLNNAQAELANAQATAVLQQAQAEVLNSPAATAANFGGSLGCGIGLGLGVIGIVVIALLRQGQGE